MVVVGGGGWWVVVGGGWWVVGGGSPRIGASGTQHHQIASTKSAPDKHRHHVEHISWRVYGDTELRRISHAWLKIKPKTAYMWVERWSFLTFNHFRLPGSYFPVLS